MITRRMNLSTLMLATAIVILSTSCARTIRFDRSQVVPAAEGKVLLKEDKNDNYSLNIKVSNLAKPENLEPPRSVYVVWLETPQNETKNLGQLKSTSPLFTKALKASMKTVSTFRPGRIFITAEDNATLQYPSNQPVLTTGTILESGK